MSKRNVVLFKEEQRFRQPWLWGLLVLIILITLAPMARELLLQIFRNETENGESNSLVNLILTAGGVFLFHLLLILFFYGTKLVIEVRQDGIYYRFFPLHWNVHHIPLREIRNYAARTYKPIREYGGWGIRYGFGGKAYNVSGNRGVQLELNKGGLASKKVLFGSQRPDEFAAAIDAAMKTKR